MLIKNNITFYMAINNVGPLTFSSPRLLGKLFPKVAFGNKNVKNYSSLGLES